VGACGIRGCARARRIARRLSTNISAADDAEEDDVAKPHQQIDLPDPRERGEDLHPDGRADKAADQQDRAHFQVHRLAPEMRQHAREGGGDDLVRLGRHGHGGRDADEEQKRRHQEPAADAEHARQDADEPPKPSSRNAFTLTSAMGR
jgi:hypothetical protein